MLSLHSVTQGNGWILLWYGHGFLKILLSYSSVAIFCPCLACKLRGVLFLHDKIKKELETTKSGMN